MKIGIIQASSQRNKNTILYEYSLNAVKGLGHEVINFGVSEDSEQEYSYIEAAINVSLLLSSGAIDFVISGCSSGQGMMLACNALPNVMCAYAPTPQDAFLFGRINNGNAISIPLGLNYGWSGEINLGCILDKLFDGNFGVGYPPQDANRKKHDSLLLKDIISQSKKTWEEIIDLIDPITLKRALSWETVFNYIMDNSNDEKLKKLISKFQQDNIGEDISNEI